MNLKKKLNKTEINKKYEYINKQIEFLIHWVLSTLD